MPTPRLPFCRDLPAFNTTTVDGEEMRIFEDRSVPSAGKSPTPITWRATRC